MDAKEGLKVERSEIYDFLPILVLILTMMLTPQIPQDIRQIFQVVGIAGCFMAMFGVDAVMRVTAAKYPHIEMLCRPSGKKLRLFIKENGISSKEIEPGVYATKIDLGVKVKHEFYHMLEYVVIKHRLRWEERVELTGGKAMFKGYLVDHPQTAKITVYEPFLGSVDVDHLSPIPVFWLKEAPRDFYMPEMALAATVMANGGLTHQEMFDVRELQMENDALISQNTELKRQSMNWHQEAIRLGEVVDALKNELNAVLKSVKDFMGNVVEYFLTLREQQLTIEHGLKKLRRSKITLTKALVALILGLALIGVFIYNPGDVMGWLSYRENQFFVIVLAVIGAAAAYYMSRRR